MSTTPNFALTYLVAAQSQPEVTANADFLALDTALGGQLVHAMSDADYTLNTSATPNEALYLAYKFTGTLTQTRHIFVPTNKKLYVVMNQTNEYLSFECTAGSIGAVIAPQAPSIGDVYTLLYCDGTNVYKITGT